MEELTLAICALNAEQRLDRHVAELWANVRSIPIESELLVIDDGSTDDTAGAARRIGARVVSHDRNRGLSAARNTVLLEARTQWVLFCDDDLDISAADLLQLWNARDVAGCVVPEVRGADNRLHNAITLRWSWFEPKFDSHQEPVKHPAYPMGACFLVPTALARQVGGFDERLRLYYEDANFGWRLREAGAPVTMVCGVRATHWEHGGAPSEDRRRRASEARWVFILVSLKGWRRAAVLTLGFPRAILESLRRRSTTM